MERERDELLGRLDDVFMRLGRRFRHRMAEDALTLGQFLLLRLAFHEAPLTMGETAEGLGVSLAAATGLVDRMIRMRLLERRRSEVDRRVVMVELSDLGKRRMGELEEHRRRQLSGMMEALSTEDLGRLVELWQRVADGVERSSF